jgi:hypothetical protein
MDDHDPDTRCLVRDDRAGSAPMVKIDVEGHEHAVIEGGRSSIERDRPFIIIEILETAKFEVINTMLTEASYIDIALSPDALRH